MNSMKFILFGFVIYATYSCCQKDTYTYVDDKVKLQYKLGDTLVYQDKNGITDTFYFNKIEHRLAPTYNNDNCNSAQYRESFTYCFDTIQKKDNKTFYITIDYQEDIDIFWLANHFVLIKDYYEVKDSIVLDNQKYYQVYKFLKGLNNDTIKTIYFQYQLGVICYETFNGNTWYLIDKH